jgi:hypothetical protein
MADLLTEITTLVKSPSGVVVAGLTLGGMVWKAFEKWESVASDNDKIQVWMWLAKPRTEESNERWPEIFVGIFDRVFGTRLISWRCFGLSALISFAMGLLLTIYTPSSLRTLPFGSQVREPFAQTVITLLSGKVVVDYVSLLLTRFTLTLMMRTQRRLAWGALLVGDSILTAYLGVLGITVGHYVGGHVVRLFAPRSFLERVPWKAVSNIVLNVPLHPIQFFQVVTDQAQAFPLVVSGFVTTGWLWLYFGSVYLIKGARRFDRHMGWLNQRFDIEKHPLSSIGFVFGPMAALLFWAFVIVTRLA